MDGKMDDDIGNTDVCIASNWPDQYLQYICWPANHYRFWLWQCQSGDVIAGDCCQYDRRYHVRNLVR